MIICEKIRTKCTILPSHMGWAALQVEGDGHTPKMSRVRICLFYPAMRAMLCLSPPFVHVPRSRSRIIGPEESVLKTP